MSDASINPATLEYLKKEKAKRGKQRKVMMIVAPLLVAGIAIGGYFGVRAWRAAANDAAAKEFIAKNLAKGPSPEAFEAMRKAVDSGQFTREQLWEAGREAREREMKARMQGYFNTPAKDRDKYLDKLIDEMQKRMKEWQANQARNPTTRPNWGPRDGATTRPNDGQRDRGPGGGPGGRSDNQSPVDRAMNQEFRAAMQRRMEERGIQMPGRGGWGGGGWGGGGRGQGGGGGNRGGR